MSSNGTVPRPCPTLVGWQIVPPSRVKHTAQLLHFCPANGAVPPRPLSTSLTNAPLTFFLFQPTLSFKLGRISVHFGMFILSTSFYCRVLL
ncbi:hypothetical protein T02_990 [Trichinella nativa]|uniref:Uncharacterized protein n=1 Tax=Trichinella nativa TaxID=6335 RepID=A0A0V1LN75_9BILA|nr:hypothetical protein T02_990 [Trichinella nativa]